MFFLLNVSSNTAYSVLLTIDLILPFSTLAISKKLLSSVDVKVFFANVKVILNL